jgi:hypothetical protein
VGGWGVGERDHEREQKDQWFEALLKWLHGGFASYFSSISFFPNHLPLA